MAVEWFCSIYGRELGPLSSQQLKAMAFGGQLTPEDQIRQGTNGAWVPAGHVEGLFSAPPPVAKPLSAPIARPAPQPPPGGDEFNIVTDPNTPAARLTGRSSIAPRRKKQEQQTIVLLLGGMILLLAVVGIVLVYSPWGSKEQAEKQGADDTPKKKVQKGNEPDMDAPTAPVADLSATPGDTPSGDLVQADWVDASQSPVPRGDMEVKIQSAVVGIPRLVLPTGQFARPRSECLLIKIQLHNTSVTRKLEYTSWGVRGRPSAGVSLTDNLENHYLLQPFRRGTPEGQLTNESVYPNKSIQDVLVFQKPIENPKFKFLRLQLPARAFGEQGTLRFKIPRKMIDAADLSESTEPAGDNSEPQEGDISEIRRGIGELGGGDDDGNQDKQYNFEDPLNGGPKPPDKKPAKN